MDEIKERTPERNYGGVWVAIGDEKFLVPPLSFKRLRQLKPALDALQASSGTPATDEQIDRMIEINFVAVSRNYPSLDRDDFAEKLDLSNVKQVTEAVMQASGLRRVPTGEPPASP